MAFKHFSKNGQILPAAEATISAFNIEFTYGFGVYESIRVQDTVPLFLSEHLQRLMHSAEVIGLEHVLTKQGMSEFVQNLISKTTEPAYNLKILLIGAPKATDAQLFILPFAPFFPDKKMYTQGVSVVTQEYERLWPQAKTLNMLGSYLGYRDAKAKGGYDVLFVDHSGCIREGSRTNFFTIKDNTIFSPPEKDILLGVTRMMVLKVAEENGYVIKEKTLPLSEVLNFDGAFLTSTSSKIVPIKKIDAQEYPTIAPELVKLEKLFNEFLKQYLSTENKKSSRT